MGRLDSFKPKKLVIGSPYMTITTNGISLNKSAIARLEYAEYVRILVNEEEQELAVQICDASDPDKESFVKVDKKEEAQYVRWNNREFVRQLISWAPSNEMHKSGFKVPGEYLSEEKAFLFIFGKAIPLKESEDK